MGIPRSVLGGIDIPSEPVVSVDTKPVGAEENSPAAQPETFRSYVSKQLGGSFAEGVGRWNEVGMAIRRGEHILPAGARAFLPPSWVDAFVDKAGFGMAGPDALQDTPPTFKDPFPGANKDRKKFRDYQREDTGVTPDKMRWGANMMIDEAQGRTPELEIGQAPGPISKNIGQVAAFTGAAASLPIPMGGIGGGSAGKYLLGAMGSGEVSDLAGRVAKNVTRAFGGDERSQHIMEGIGEFGGGVVGFPINIAKGNAIIDVLSFPYKKGKQAVEAAYSAYKKRATDTRDTWDIFKDDYSHLSSQTQGGIQQKANEIVANDLRQDPEFKESAAQFDAAVETLNKDLVARGQQPVDPKKFGIATRSATPSLVGTVQQMRPLTPESVRILASSYKEPSTIIKNTFDRINEGRVAVDATKVVKQIDNLKKTQNLQVEGLVTAAERVADTTPAMSQLDLAAQGKKIYDIAEARHKVANEEKNALYEASHTLDEKINPAGYDASSVLDKAKVAIKGAFAQVTPSTVPESIRNLKNILGKAKEFGPQFDDIIKQMSPEMQQWFSQEFKPSGKPVTLRVLNSAITLLHNDASIANRGAVAGDTAKALEEKNLTEIAKAIEGVITEKGKEFPQIIEARNKAVQNYKENYVPIAKEGINLKMRGEGAGMRKGEENYIDPSNVLLTYLAKDSKSKQVRETQMEQFDNLFGGRVGSQPKNEEAYQELGRSIESQYNREVLKGSAEGLTEKAHNDFLHEYEVALNRVPGLREKLTGVAEKIFDLKAEKTRIEDRFKTIIDSPLTAYLGGKADETIARGLGDPRMMGQLIKGFNLATEKLGGGKGEGTKALFKEIMARATPYTIDAAGVMKYEPEKIAKLLSAGKVGEEGIGGLQVLARAALGKVEGDAHIDRLKALSVIAQRNELTNPKYLRPSEPFPSDPYFGVSGQSGATWITNWHALQSGRISGAYFTGLGATRFLNSKLKELYNNAYQKALFDPETSEAIYKLATTSAKDPLNKQTFDKVWGTGKAAVEYAKKLVEVGLLKKHVSDAARVTATVMANEDKDAQRNKTESYNEPVSTRIRAKENK